MSEYETTDLGGDPVEFEFVEGGTYERGVIRSTADRQQTRRDAEEELSGESRMSYNHAAELLARHCLALLTELEQAEERLNREGVPIALINKDDRIDKLEARLANVPPLISFLRTVLDERLLPPRSDDEARDLLAAWDDQ